MNNKAHYLLGLGVSVLITACSTTGPSLPENVVVGELPTMTLPRYEVDQKVEYTDELTGDSESWTITDISEDGTVSAITSKGCKWSTSAAWFDGVGSWDNCGGTGNWSAGINTAVEAGPSLWPLTDGAKAKYKYKTVNKAGEVIIRRRSCEVSTANIETGIGPLDAYKVVCTDKDSGGSINVRTWYFNPEHGELRYSRWQPNGGMRTHLKYL